MHYELCGAMSEKMKKYDKKLANMPLKRLQKEATKIEHKLEDLQPRDPNVTSLIGMGAAYVATLSFLLANTPAENQAFAAGVAGVIAVIPALGGYAAGAIAGKELKERRDMKRGIVETKGQMVQKAIMNKRGMELKKERG